MHGTYPDPDLIQQFVLESSELLQSIEQSLIALESSPPDNAAKDAELLNQVFRAWHTIKGSAAFLGLEPLALLSHRAEDILSGLRRREIPFSRRIATALFAARDQLGHMVEDLDRGALQTYAMDELLAELERCRPAESVGSIPEKDSPEKEAPTQSYLDVPPPDEVLVPPTTAATGLALASAPQTMRVDVRKLDDLIGLVGELVLERNRLLQLVNDISYDTLAEESPLARTAARISSLTKELQSASLRARMVPMQSVFSRIPRLVRDLSLSLHKEVELVMSGEATEIDRTLAELLSGPLVHLVRNALDHGVELPAEREHAGKPRRGRLCLEAKPERDGVTISVSDDGAGIEPLRILGMAIEKNMVAADQAAQLSPREILDLVFLPGLSTSATAGAVSGRGIGMDVVRSSLKQMNGSVELHSHAGRGTTVLLHLPLTLAILPVLLVQADSQIFALLPHSIVETARASEEMLHWAEGAEIVRLRDEILPLIRLHSWCASPQHPPTENLKSDQKIVVMTAGEQHVALLVDGLSGQESTVINPLAPSARRVPGHRRRHHR